MWSFILSLIVYSFQFHKGTIKTLQEFGVLQLAQVHFNSIKVRLKPTTADTLSFNGSKFQFHKGTIKTGYYFY